MESKNNLKNRPIGVFDSGIGGLTVARAISDVLPDEKLIYFGDTVHLPYGEKSAEAIREYSKSIVDFLLQKNVKALVIACNSMSSYAYDDIEKQKPDDVLLVDVIRPAIDYIEEEKYQSLGIIGTRATISSNIHLHLLSKNGREMDIYTQATPLLVPMIEEGYFNNSISHEIIDNYLSYPPFANIEALLLACTHYPLIKQEISDYYKGEVDVIDNAEVVAEMLKKELEENDLKATSPQGPDEFYVSDYTQSFEKTTKIFFGEQIQIQKANIWSDE